MPESVIEPPPKLPTTSFAVLGLLALRPWTGYELTQQFHRSLAYCWPKAESVLYEEPRRLTRLGLARADEESSGRRRRTRYSITDTGHEALRRWLAGSAQPPRLEIESMLRLLFADQGDVDDLSRSVAGLRAWAEQGVADGVPVVAEFLATGGPFPERNHLSVLFARYFADLYEMTIAWCDVAEAEIATWTATAGQGMTPGSRVIADEVTRRFSKPGGRTS